MKEARIILPIDDAQSTAINDTLHHIIAAFGGATEFSGNGFWLPPHDTSLKFLAEEIRVVDIAYEPSEENDHKLFDIATAYRIDAKQKSVYLRYGNGHVQMVEENSEMDNGHGHFAPSLAGVLEAVNVLTDKGCLDSERIEAFEFLQESV